MGVIAPIYRCLERPQTCGNWAISYLVESVFENLNLKINFFVTTNLENNCNLGSVCLFGRLPVDRQIKLELNLPIRHIKLIPVFILNVFQLFPMPILSCTLLDLRDLLDLINISVKPNLSKINRFSTRLDSAFCASTFENHVSFFFFFLVPAELFD